MISDDSNSPADSVKHFVSSRKAVRNTKEIAVSSRVEVTSSFRNDEENGS